MNFIPKYAWNMETILVTNAITACLSLFGLAFISNSSVGKKPEKQLRQLFSQRSGKIQLIQSFFSDWSIWLATGWILSRQQQTIHHQSNATLSGSKKGYDAWLFLSDFSFTGLLILLRKSILDEKSRNESTEHQKVIKKENSSASDSFLRQIEVNLGLTPKSHNRSSDVNVEDLATTIFPKSHMIHSSQRDGSIPSISKRNLELLVHNVSHTDLILSLTMPSRDAEESPYNLCRPRFSAFEGYSRRVLKALAGTKEKMQSCLISFPRHSRSGVVGESCNKPHNQDQKIPIGFSLGKYPINSKPDENLSIADQELNDLRLRGRDASRRWTRTHDSTALNAVFFPLLAMLLPQWEARLQEKYNSLGTQYNEQSDSDNSLCKKVVILVSGVGSPRNWTHSMDGNSTEQCAKLMKLFINTLYPDWVVVLVHSTTNLFRYDENIAFVQNELLPCVQSYRDAHATGIPYPDEVNKKSRIEHCIKEQITYTPFDPDWGKTMNVTLSFADGSPARNHAIQAALRPYRPTYFHCWQLKTFWHELKIVDADIEVHSFEEMETLPPVDLTTTMSNQRFKEQQPIARKVVEEMRLFRDEMEILLKKSDNESHDLRSFWLRKTRKPVLAVLAVQMSEGGPVKLYRGTNMEVSMPTGSLCAERNVIGTALANNPALKRHHLKTIAVLSVPVGKGDSVGRRSRAPSSTSLGSGTSSNAISRHNSIDFQEPKLGELLLEGTGTLADSSTAESKQPSLNTPTQSLQDTGKVPSTVSLGMAASPSSTSVRRISLYQHSGNPSKGMWTDNGQKQANNRKSVVVMQSSEDLNPLRPCGACNEWLKKIAETNPYFQILTFTDSKCSGVYCSPCSE